LDKSNGTGASIKVDVDEKAVPEDKTSGLPSITPLWGGYCPETKDGKPTPFAEVLYGNYCREEDYQYLEKKGYDLAGKIVICRYGKIFRAQKVEFAEKVKHV
jgi:N-acetylated-alpha-linked acidic dipeptidase